VPPDDPSSQVLEYRKPARHRLTTSGERLYGGFLVVAAVMFGLFALATGVLVLNAGTFRPSRVAMVFGAVGLMGGAAWFCGRLATEFFTPPAETTDEVE
jgi:hypothetical protein